MGSQAWRLGRGEKGEKMSLYPGNLTVLHFPMLECPSEEAFLRKKAT